jgi:hypothetical protein
MYERAVIPAPVLVALAGHAASMNGQETGGILLGHALDATTLRITKASPPGPGHCTADSHSRATPGFYSNTSTASTTAAKAAKTTSASGTYIPRSTPHLAPQIAGLYGGSPGARTMPPIIPSWSSWSRHLHSAATAPMALSRNPSGPTTSCASNRCRSRRANLSPPKALDAVHTRALSQAATVRVCVQRATAPRCAAGRTGRHSAYVRCVSF